LAGGVALADGATEIVSAAAIAMTASVRTR
jgi:hypothetical protein